MNASGRPTRRSLEHFLEVHSETHLKGPAQTFEEHLTATRASELSVLDIRDYLDGHDQPPEDLDEAMEALLIASKSLPQLLDDACLSIHPNRDLVLTD